MWGFELSFPTTHHLVEEYVKLSILPASITSRSISQAVSMSIFTVVVAWALLTTVAMAQTKGSPDLPKSDNMYKCDMGDAECWNAECLYWTNKIRKDAGVAPIAMGSMGMLNNAEDYSRTLDRMKGLKHQDIGSIKLPCGMRVFGENIAYNFDSKNPAWYCMNQWKKSPGHYENIVRARFASVVTGVYVADNGRVSCTQIFAPSEPEGGERGCTAAPTNFPRGSAPRKTPKPAPSTTSTATATPTPTPSMSTPKKEKPVKVDPSPSPSNTPSPTPSMKKDEGEKDQPKCRRFTLWGKYNCEMCRGSRYWTCRAK